MSHGRPAAKPVPESLTPEEGWHCSHHYYRFDRGILKQMTADQRREGCESFRVTLDSERDKTTERLQVSIVSGHKADFGLMLMDPDPLKIDSIHQELLAGPIGHALVPAYSFVSLTEISEYVPSVEQYAARLVAEGEQAGSPTYEAKVKAYSSREPMMRKQRLFPDFPTWPVTCFYPMNKKRKVGENWFLLPQSERQRMMSEHATSGMAFAGRVTQLITVALGVEDWEWGVTLWAKNPQYLKDIVYRMRFDEASARFAEFGPFYTSYIANADRVLAHCHVE